MSFDWLPLYPSSSKGGALPSFSNRLLGGGSSSVDFTAGTECVFQMKLNIVSENGRTYFGEACKSGFG